MRARHASCHALIYLGLTSALPSFADDSPKKAVETRSTAPASIAPATLAEVNREKDATDARLKSLQTAEDKNRPATKPLVEILKGRHALLLEWIKANSERIEAEKPAKTPEAEASELKAELEKTHALLDQSQKSPDILLPEVFQAVEKEKDKAIDARRLDPRLNEMKEAIESARVDLKDQSAQLETLRAEGSRTLASDFTTLRASRDKVFQALAGLNAQRGERQASLASNASGEARDLVKERFVNLDWQAQLEVERLASLEARIALATRRIDLATLQIQTKAARVQLAKRLAERMESRYATLAEGQRSALKQAVAQEENRASHLNDPLERRRAQRTAQLLELESQVVAYEKSYATTSGASIQEQTGLKDKTVTDFEELKKLLDDGTVSPLDALRLKNDFRRIGPERAQIVRTDLAESEAELTTYENALTDAEIDLVNDSRDDRFDRESLLEQLPASRRAEASAMLEDLETRYRGLLNRRRNVLRNLARRAEEAHDCVLKRIETLDLQYAFIRTHIFWIRDAEPLGATTLAHARDDSLRTAKALVHLTMEAGDKTLWSRPAPDFLLALLALIVMPLPLHLGRRALDRLRLPGVAGTRSCLIGLASSATWPAYLALVAYAAKAGPWPRDLAWPACSLLLGLAAAWFFLNAGRMAFRNGGWAEEVLKAPRDVTRQMRRVVLTMMIAGLMFLLPQALLGEGLIAPGGRPIAAAALGRMMAFGFELTVWVLAYRLLRSTSPLLNWLAEDPPRLGWAGRHRRIIGSAILVSIGLVLALDGAGFRFTSRRLTFGGLYTMALAVAGWAIYRGLLHLIAKQAWRWKKAPKDQGPAAVAEGMATTSPEEEGADADAKLRTLARVVVGLLALFGLSTIWNVDFALFSYISEQPIGLVVDKQAIHVGDVLAMSLIFFITAGAWRYLHTCFTLTIFPRMPDDPGIRFAVVTLCRYLVLAVGVLAGLSSVHLGMEKVGVVLAALGVGLGFGLQEIVSNFVSGIILLLERPIRVGDIVTVSEMTGKVDQINIRATTIINGDNQCMIVPNRQFITGNVVNWTHNDKIMRLAIPVNVALGTELDKVSDLLLAIAREDADVLNNPVPSAFIDSYGESSVKFVLSVHVPEPSLMGRVRHRLYGQIQHRFEAAGIVIPLPTHQLHVHSLDTGDMLKPHNRRLDRKEVLPPTPLFASRMPLPVPAEDCHRGVDE